MLKQLHVACVVLSGVGFLVRGLWMATDSPLLLQPWVRRVPHVVDTLLLASAIALAVMLQQYPLVHGWLTAKVVGLLLYIGLGMLALKPRRPKPQRVAAWLAAMATFGYIVSVALTKDAAGPLRLFEEWIHG